MSEQSPGQPPVPRSYDDDLRRRAEKQLKRKAQFRQHLSSYLVVNGLLVAIWALTGRSYFWPIWPILGWGVGLAFDALSLRDGGPPTLAQIEAEAERLRRRDERRGAAGMDGVDGASSGRPLGPGGSALPPTPNTSGPWDMTPGPQDGR